MKNLSLAKIVVINLILNLMTWFVPISEKDSHSLRSVPAIINEINKYKLFYNIRIKQNQMFSSVPKDSFVTFT